MAKVKRSFPERTHLLIAAAVVALFLFSGWMMRRGAPPVRAEQVTRQQIASFISTNGRVEPVQDFEPHATAQLPVKSVSVHEGDHVKAGQLLIQLDDAEARAQAAKALAELRAAEADLHAVQSGGTQEEILTVRSDMRPSATWRPRYACSRTERHPQERWKQLAIACKKLRLICSS